MRTVNVFSQLVTFIGVALPNSPGEAQRKEQM